MICLASEVAHQQRPRQSQRVHLLIRSHLLDHLHPVELDRSISLGDPHLPDLNLLEEGSIRMELLQQAVSARLRPAVDSEHQHTVDSERLHQVDFEHLHQEEIRSEEEILSQHRQPLF